MEAAFWKELVKQLKYDFYILVHRDKWLKLLMLETLIVFGLSVVLFSGKNASFYASKYDWCYLLNQNTQFLTLLLVFTLPIWNSLVHADVDFADDEMKDMILSRTNAICYYLSKYIIVFISAFLNAFFVFELLYLFQYLALDHTFSYNKSEISLQILIPESEQRYFQSILYRFPNLYYQLQIIVISLFGGSVAIISYAISQKLTIRPLVYLGGFIVCIVLTGCFHLIGFRLNLWAYIDLFTLNYMVQFEGSEWFILLGFIFWIVVVPLVFIFGGMRKYVKEENKKVRIKMKYVVLTSYFGLFLLIHFYLRGMYEPSVIAYETFLLPTIYFEEDFAISIFIMILWLVPRLSLWGYLFYLGYQELQAKILIYRLPRSMKPFHIVRIVASKMTKTLIMVGMIDFALVFYVGNISFIKGILYLMVSLFITMAFALLLQNIFVVTKNSKVLSIAVIMVVCLLFMLKMIVGEHILEILQLLDANIGIVIAILCVVIGLLMKSMEYCLSKIEL